MAKQPSTTPMECQPFYYGDAKPMAPAPTERGARTPRSLARAMAEGEADVMRKRSLKAQRAQISEQKARE
jgi:hypothetical protein